MIMKKYSIQFILFSALLFSIALLTNYLIDPYRIFHKPWVRENYYVPEMRIQASGIINTEKFDSIVLGTSMADNFSPAEASKVFGQKFTNISLNGSSLAERSLVLNYALEKEKLVNVISSLDPDTFDKDSITGTPIAPYAYLYDGITSNDLQLYASDPTILRFALCRNILFTSDMLCHDTRELEDLTEWHSIKAQKERFGGLHNWLTKSNDHQIKAALANILKSIQVINSGQAKAVNWAEVARETSKNQQVFTDCLLYYAAKYPKTKFYLFFPPHSRLRYAIMKQSNPQAFEVYLEILRFVVRESKRYENVKVFGFETELFLDDIANYKDTTHYHQRFNSKMLYWMKNGEHELTTSNLDDYIKDITTRATNYSVNKIGDQINDYSSGSFIRGKNGMAEIMDDPR